MIPLNKFYTIKIPLIISVIYLALAVILGALGAHMLKEVLSADQLSSYQTAVSYQMNQSLGALLLLVLSILFNPLSRLKSAATLLLIGVLLFSGSIYLLVLPFFDFLPSAVIGPITPIGGIFFILGWTVAIYHIIKTK